LISQHFPRVVRQRFVPFLAARLAEELTDPVLTALSTGYVVFFFVQQRKHVSAFARAADNVRLQWRGQIEPWPTVAEGRPNTTLEPAAPVG
jgi:hypothetical protein